jgi:CubicO group peptidase (beta-lactamase class C family)
MTRILTLLAVITLAIACSEKKSSDQSVPSSELEAKIDSIVTPLIDSSKIAGVAVAVFKDNKPVMLKSYGFADLEYGVQLPVNASFEIGSVTKQFTAVATLQLAEQGKINLDDDITKYIKFDTKGKKVTVRQLLNHTSGIKGYTELPMFESLAAHKYKRDTLLRLVEKEPFDFEPGEALIYNNTGFFMLGLIIEKVSGISYEEYIKKNLFEKAGMTDSYYCNETKIVKNRAHGYQMGKDGLARADYLDHTWPYAAGSLCSTVVDLVRWNDALHHGKILGEEAYKEFISPSALNDGTPTHYAKGITVTEENGRKMIAHGGAIPGFFAENNYFPDENVSVVVLLNTIGPVGGGTIVDPIIDTLFPEAKMEKSQFTGDRSKYAGKYSGPARGKQLSVVVTSNDSSLVIQRDTDKPETLEFVSDDTWSNGREKFLFTSDGLKIDQVYGFYLLKKVP